MKLFEQGRKFVLSFLYLTVVLAVLAASFFLAVKGKLTGDWVQIVTVVLPVLAVVIGGFSASNAYVSGKAIDAGLQAPISEGGAKT
jgi:hypothetical protein